MVQWNHFFLPLAVNSLIPTANQIDPVYFIEFFPFFSSYRIAISQLATSGHHVKVFYTLPIKSLRDWFSKCKHGSSNGTIFSCHWSSTRWFYLFALFNRFHHILLSPICTSPYCNRPLYFSVEFWRNWFSKCKPTLSNGTISLSIDCQPQKVDQFDLFTVFHLLWHPSFYAIRE